MQIIGDPIGAVEVSVDKPNTCVKALQSVIRDQRFLLQSAPDENLGDKRCVFVYFSL